MRSALQDAFINPLEAAFMQTAELKRRGEFAKALQLLAQAVRQRFVARLDGNDPGGGDPATDLKPVDMLAIEQLADLALLFGETSAADDLLASAAIWYQRAGNQYFCDYLTVKRIHVALGSGRLIEARDMLFAMQPSIGDVKAISFSQAGLARWEQTLHWPGTQSQDRGILLSQLYLEMGQILAGSGQYRDATSVIGRGLQTAKQTGPQAGYSVLAHLNLAQAAAHLESGDLTRAQQHLNEARSAVDEFTQPGLFIRSLELAGKLALLAGRFGEALECFKQICAICQKHGFDKARSTASLNLAHVLIYLSQTSDARDLLESIALRAGAGHDIDNAERAGFLMEIADARGHSLADGVPIAPSVSEMWQAAPTAVHRSSTPAARDPLDIEQSPNYLMFFEDRALAFHCYLGRRDFHATGKMLADIEKTFTRTDSQLIATRLQVMRGMLAYYEACYEGYYKNDFARAGALLQEACATLRELGLKPEQWQVQRFIGWCWAAQKRPQMEQQELARDTQKLSEEMTHSLAPADRAFYLLNKWTADEEYIANQINRFSELREQMQRTARPLRFRRRWQLWKEIHALLEHIDEYKRIVAQRTVAGEEIALALHPASSLWSRLWNHPRDRVTISFLVLPDRVFIARAGWLSLDFGVSPVTRIQLRDRVRQWHQPLLDFISGGRGARRAQGDEPDAGSADDQQNDNIETLKKRLGDEGLAARLAEDLQLPALINSLPRRIRALTIIPDDSLHGFPFAAINYEGSYLIERYALSIAFESRERRVVPRLAPRKEALAVGVSKGSGDFEPLSATPLELQYVAGWMAAHNLNCHRLDDVTSTDRWPSKATVIEMLPCATLFHIACHGVFKPDQPDASGMVFVPAPDRIEVLSLRDLAALDLSSLRHATLSSCWSADHFVLPGRWVISLPETFYRAGAHSVLACLWVVNDVAGVALMRRFYDYLDHHPRDEALRLAQLDCLRQQLPDCQTDYQRHPIFWAGFNLYGHPGALHL